MTGVADTLFSIFDTGVLPGAPALFIGARNHPFLRDRKIILQQYFKPYIRELEEAGFSADPEIPDITYACAFVLLPKNIIEARYEVARALSLLKDGGLLVCAGANDAGGRRAQKMLEEFGLDPMRQVSANKAKAAGGWKNGMNEAVMAALEAGVPRIVEETGYYSQPGLFAWDRADKGSEILARELPEDLAGTGADLGCGYGFLARHVLDHCKQIKNFICVDADWRAVQACKINLQDIAVPVTYLWEDVLQDIPGLHRQLDFVVMNPPFHEGKKSSSEIGRAFIRQAAAALKSAGELWLVANSQLPYEKDISEYFSQCQKFYEGGGYKIWRAVK